MTANSRDEMLFGRDVAAAAAAGDLDALRRARAELTRAHDRARGDHERGFHAGLLAVITASQELARARRGIAQPSDALEPGSLAARMLVEIAGGVRGANADLADRLDTDQWQVSRAGRKLRDLGLAERTRSGRLNVWSLTSAGERVADRLRRNH